MRRRSQQEIVAHLRRAALSMRGYAEPTENQAATLIENQAARIAELEAAFALTNKALMEATARPYAAPAQAEPKLTPCRHCGFRVALNEAPALSDPEKCKHGMHLCGLCGFPPPRS